MKKSLIMFLLITVIVSMLLSGCSDDKKSSTGPDDPSESDFTFGISEISREGREVEYFVGVFSNNDTEISSVLVTVNGITYDLASSYEGFLTSITLPDNGAYDYEVVINGDENFEFNLQPTFAPDVNWPEEYVLSEGLDLSWTLINESNPDHQEIRAWGWNQFGEVEEEDFYEDLSNSARSFTLPANWCSSEMDSFELDLFVARYQTTGELLIMSIGESSENYYSYDGAKTSKIELLKSFSKKFLKM